MIVLDTNVISEVRRPRCDTGVSAWFALQDLSDLFLCAPTVAELSFGGHKTLLRYGSDRYRADLVELMDNVFAGRILKFGHAEAFAFGRLRADREAKALPTPIIDLQIAAICIANGATLATRNVRGFDALGLDLINPFAHGES